jgi:hypothetical protein
VEPSHVTSSHSFSCHLVHHQLGTCFKGKKTFDVVRLVKRVGKFRFFFAWRLRESTAGKEVVSLEVLLLSVKKSKAPVFEELYCLKEAINFNATKTIRKSVCFYVGSFTLKKSSAP